MSDWTYVRGVMELSCSPYENKYKVPCPFTSFKNLSEEDEKVLESWRRKYNKGKYLPYPEEQFKITTPMMINRYKKPKKKDGSDNNEWDLYVRQAYVYSLPRARKYLDEAFKLLPQGECGFEYAIKQSYQDGNSTMCYSGSFDYDPCLYKYYKDAINKLYKCDDSWCSYTFEDLVKYQRLDKACHVSFAKSMTLGIMQSLRWCDCDEFEKGLENFFQYLRDNDFSIENVLLEWHDTYGYLYKCNCYANYEDIVFEHYNQGDKLIYRKTYYYPKDENGFIDYTNFDEKHPLVKEEKFEG